jgi:hypothetical protein
MEYKNDDSKYKIVQLKKILEKASLPTEGGRQEVLERLKQNKIDLYTPSDSEEDPPEKKEEEKFQWQWYDSFVWMNYDDETSSLLEDAYTDDKDEIVLKHGFFGREGGYKINFKNSTQTKLSTGYARAIRRQKVEDRDSKSSSEDDEEASDNDEQWEWLDDSGWMNYDSTTNDILIKEFASGKSKIILKHGFFGRNKLGFTIDFTQMLQINNSTGYVRNIRKGGSTAVVTPSFTFSPITFDAKPVPPPPAEPTITWEYQKDNTWRQFEPQITRMIEGMYSRGTATVNLHFGEWAKCPSLLDFKEESLTETKSSNCYPIRRNPPMDKPKNTKKKKLPPN